MSLYGTSIAVAFVIAGFVSAACADMRDESVGVRCDKAKALVVIDAEGSDYDLDSLPQYTQGKKAKIVCNLGLNKQVSLIGGRSEQHPGNDNISIVVQGDVVARLWFAWGGSVSVDFSRNKEVDVNDCSNGPGVVDSCRVKGFRTVFTPSSRNFPSFECDRATTVAQHLICDDAGLAAGDRELTAVYRRALAQTSNRQKLVSEQKLWLLLQRDFGCSLETKLYPVDIDAAKACLVRVYRDRIVALKAVTR